MPINLTTSDSLSKPCANCDTMHNDKKSAFCSPFCKEIASHIRICRNWMREENRQEDQEYLYALGIRVSFLNAAALGGDVYHRTIPASIRKQVWARDKGMCQWPKCHNPGQEIDHIEGDSNELTNLQLLCKPHHHAKTMAMLRMGEELTPEEIIIIAEFQSRIGSRIDSPTPMRICDNEQLWSAVWRAWPDIEEATYKKIEAKVTYRELIKRIGLFFINEMEKGNG